MIHSSDEHTHTDSITNSKYKQQMENNGKNDNNMQRFALKKKYPITNKKTKKLISFSTAAAAASSISNS